MNKGAYFPGVKIVIYPAGKIHKSIGCAAIIVLLSKLSAKNNLSFRFFFN
jgi:hypothetical protein